METKLTFEEELAVSSAVSSRIRDLSETIEDCHTLGVDTSVLINVRDNLLAAYLKLTGVDYSKMHNNE